MASKRSHNPRMWTESEDFFALSIPAKLLWNYLIDLADDEGYHTFSILIFSRNTTIPADKIQGLLDEMLGRPKPMIELQGEGSDRSLRLTAWLDHQSLDRPLASAHNPNSILPKHYSEYRKDKSRELPDGHTSGSRGLPDGQSSGNELKGKEVKGREGNCPPVLTSGDTRVPWQIEKDRKREEMDIDIRQAKARETRDRNNANLRHAFDLYENLCADPCKDLLPPDLVKHASTVPNEKDHEALTPWLLENLHLLKRYDAYKPTGTRKQE